jgi:hypothetical protein
MTALSCLSGVWPGFLFLRSFLPSFFRFMSLHIDGVSSLSFFYPLVFS